MRKIITELHRAEALKDVAAWLYRAVELKGEGAFASFHELRGVLGEEYHELMEVMHERKPYLIERELKDLAVVAIFGLACLRAGALP